MRHKLLDEVLNQKPTVPLYHYTQQNGFLGIIQSAKIWATHTQYLNDLREYSHAVDMVRTQIKAIRAFGDRSLGKTLQDMEDGLDGIENMNVCVCSFSEARDSLSQWRAYTASSSGFAIGFTGSFLKEVADRESWYFAPCIYDPKIQSELISAMVQEVIMENLSREKARSIGKDYMPPGGSLNAYLHRYAPILKDYAFREEKEWRIISRPKMCTSNEFDFRQGDSMLIPYFKLKLSDEPATLKIEEIVVGPTPHPKQSYMSAKSFMVRHSLKDAPVTSSSVPYRSW